MTRSTVPVSRAADGSGPPSLGLPEPQPQRAARARAAAAARIASIPRMVAGRTGTSW